MSKSEKLSVRIRNGMVTCKTMNTKNTGKHALMDKSEIHLRNKFKAYTQNSRFQMQFTLK